MFKSHCELIFGRFALEVLFHFCFQVCHLQSVQFNCGFVSCIQNDAKNKNSTIESSVNSSIRHLQDSNLRGQSPNDF